MRFRKKIEKDDAYINSVLGLCGVSKNLYNYFNIREFVADSVIQASGMVEFEDGLRTGVLLGGCWDP